MSRCHCSLSLLAFCTALGAPLFSRLEPSELQYEDGSRGPVWGRQVWVHEYPGCSSASLGLCHVPEGTAVGLGSMQIPVFAPVGHLFLPNSLSLRERQKDKEKHSACSLLAFVRSLGFSNPLPFVESGKG